MHILNYDDETTLLSEWICLDGRKGNVERRVINLTDVFYKVGGLEHLLVLFCSFFFKPYAMYTFKADAINSFFKIKSNDKSLVHDNKLKLSFCNKFRIMFGLCPSSKLKRVLYSGYKGQRRILKELDIVRIVNEIKHLKHITRSLDPLDNPLEQKNNSKEIDLDKDSADEIPPLE